METFVSFFYIILGFFLRLAVPILGTVVLVFILRGLDARWQAEAERQAAKIEKPHCWKIQGSTPIRTTGSPRTQSSLPCWQVYRLPNGYLNEECIHCEIFIDAPVPTLTVEPRRL